MTISLKFAIKAHGTIRDLNTVRDPNTCYVLLAKILASSLVRYLRVFLRIQAKLSFAFIWPQYYNNQYCNGWNKIKWRYLLQGRHWYSIRICETYVSDMHQPSTFRLAYPHFPMRQCSWLVGWHSKTHFHRNGWDHLSSSFQLRQTIKDLCKYILI